MIALGCALSLPPRSRIVNDAKMAFEEWSSDPKFNVGVGFNCSEGMVCNDCHWTGSTFLLGVIDYYKASGDPHAIQYAWDWANYYDYNVCGEKKLQNYNKPLHHNINHQLSGSIYIELYNLDGNKTHLESITKLLDTEIADPTSTNFWSWIDAAHMAMNTFSRLANATGQRIYFEKQFVNFNASVLAEADGTNLTFGFWNRTDQLLYRDDRFLGTQVYWSRGNGWALAALVAAMQFGKESDPHYTTYLSIFTPLATRLKDLQSSDGAWRSSLLDPVDFPVAETSGTASFAYGIAWGIANGILLSSDFLPVVERAWAWLSQVALHANGTVGYCQPGGSDPENDFNQTTTTNFCVGLFLRAASQISALAH